MKVAARFARQRRSVRASGRHDVPLEIDRACIYALVGVVLVCGVVCASRFHAWPLIGCYVGATLRVGALCVVCGLEQGAVLVDFLGHRNPREAEKNPIGDSIRKPQHVPLYRSYFSSYSPHRVLRKHIGVHSATRRNKRST